jgi:hypothetical protein
MMRKERRSERRKGPPIFKDAEGEIEEEKEEGGGRGHPSIGPKKKRRKKEGRRGHPSIKIRRRGHPSIRRKGHPSRRPRPKKAEEGANGVVEYTGPIPALVFSPAVD